MKELLRKLLNRLPLLCGCMLCKTYGDVRDSKGFSLTWKRGQSRFGSHTTVSQCNNCKRLYMWSNTLHISGYTTFEEIFEVAQSQRWEIEKLRDELIGSDMEWGVTEIEEVEYVK